MQLGPPGLFNGRLPTSMIEFTTGYFIHDVVDMLGYGKLTSDMVIHHASSILGGFVALITDTCSGFWLLGASAELNSISFHIRSILQHFKARKTIAFKLNVCFFALTFLISRIGIQGFGLYESFRLLIDATGSRLHRLLGAFGTASGIGLLGLNTQLFLAIYSSDILRISSNLVSKRHWTQ